MTSEEPIVTLKNGTIVGTKATNLDGDEILKFLGVPYGKPPVGSLRFKAPQPADPWTGTLDCTKDGNPNLSNSFFSGILIGSEDCLYLNVHTRSLPKAGEPLKPVMVFIHGGAFTMGSGTQTMCDPKYLLTKDVVLVSMNYRLGIFGFLSVDDTSLDVPGNAGLKDQRLALQWVQENIEKFNGDPKNVTIYGVSAGGASVQFQVISSSTKGLFHKAIAQSGSVFNPWAWGQKNAIHVAEVVTEKSVKSEKEALELLTKVPANELYLKSLTLQDEVVRTDIRRPFGPVIEKPNPTAFLTEEPEKLLASGNYNHVPLIQGVCSNEGLIYDFKPLVIVPEDFKPENHVLCWNVRTNSSKNPSWQNKLVDLYYKDGVTKDAIYSYIGDACFNVGIYKSIHLALKNASHPIYFYVFDYNTDLKKSIHKIFQLDEKVNGNAHGVDGMYLSPFNAIPGLISNLSDSDLEAVKTMVQIWTDFAYTGNPHSKWEPVSDIEDLSYLELAEGLRLLKNPFGDRMKVWHDIIEEAGGFDCTAQEKPIQN